MKKYLKYVVPAVTVFVAILVFKIPTREDPSGTRRQNMPLVKVGAPVRQDMKYSLQFTGDMLPATQANILPKVGGNLEHVYVDMGAEVGRNQLLALIDTADLHQSYQQVAATYQNTKITFGVIKGVRPKLMSVPGTSVFINPGGFFKFLLNFGAPAPIDVEIRGFDLDTGSKLAKEIAGVGRSVPAAVDVQITREENLPELRVKIDRDKAGALGVNVSEISNTVNTCINGSVASLYTD